MIQVVLFSGSLINRIQLQSDLGLENCSEKEILSAGFERWGTELFPRLNGLFSFVLFEESSGCYYCCRDRFGGKGLYYTFGADGTPLFSETVQGLLERKKLRPVFREELLEVYLSYSYIPGEETVFEGIRKPLPGYCYCFSDGTVTKERFWIPKFQRKESAPDEWEALLADTLDSVFSGTEKGGASLLSSGVDSSYLCKRLSVQDTYTAAYAEDSFSESEAAEAFSGKIGARHHSIEITPEVYLASVPGTMRALEQPTGDASAPVLYSVCKAIRPHTASCYSGEGIDELFLGYYLDTLREIPDGESLFDAGYIGSTSCLSEAEKERFLKHYTPSRKMEFTEEAYGLSAQEDRLSQAALVDLLVWFNGNLLPNIFGIGNATGLQLLTPYLDNRLLDLSTQIPSVLKNDAFQTKIIFRRAAGRLLEREDAARPKRGFPVPIRLWLRRPDYVRKLRQAFRSDTAFRFFNREELLACYDAMLSDPEDDTSWRAIWCIYCFLVWYDEMINPYASVLRWQVWDPQFNREEAWPGSEFPEATFHFMKESGCLVTSLATALRLHGIETEEEEDRFNPWIFTQELKQRKAFTPAADLNLHALQDLYPLQYVAEEPYSAERLAERMEQGEVCLLRVPGVHGVYHFVVPVRLADGDVEIIDSGWDYDRLSRFSKVFSILRFVRRSSPLPAKEQIIQTALSYLGVQESRPNANDVPFNMHYYGREVSGPEYPWCVAFEWDIFRECGLSSLFYDGGKTASCIRLYEWAKETGRLVDRDKGQRGDIALYDWFDEKKPVHTGIILSHFCPGYYRTVEGNTTDPEEVAGCGKVMIQKRRFGGIFAIIRPDYEKRDRFFTEDV